MQLKFEETAAHGNSQSRRQSLQNDVDTDEEEAMCRIS